MATVQGRAVIGGVTYNPTANITLPTPVTGYPNASNTGVPAGTTLTAYTGPNRPAAGAVIENKLITYPITIAAGRNNVTFRRCKFQMQAFWHILTDEGATGLLVEDCEFDGMNDSGNDSAVSGYNYTLRCVNIHHTVDGLKIGSNSSVTDSYIHDLCRLGNDPHNDGIQSLGGIGMTIRHNTIIVPDGATSAIILSTGSASDMRNITIDNNLMGGGAYVVYGGYQAGVDNINKVSNIQIINNKITTQIFPKGGYYGPFTSVSAPVVLTNNTWYDGPKVGQPAS